MILLVSTSDELLLTTNDSCAVDVYASFVDYDGTNVTPDTLPTQITTATTTTIVQSPGAATQRNVKLLVIRNSHATNSVVIELEYDNGTTAVPLAVETLMAGDTLLYQDGVGFTTVSGGFFSGSGSSFDLNDNATPGTPSSGVVRLFGRSIAHRMLPAFVGPSGLDSTVQPLLARNKIGYWCPPGNATTVPGVLGYTAPTVVGTATARTVSKSTLFTRMRRLGYVSAATPAALASVRVAAAQVHIGDGTGYGGFFKVIRFGISDAVLVSSARMFVGMAVSTSAPTNVEPSTLTNVIGVGHGASDTNLFIYCGGSAAQTPIDLGANFPTNTTQTDVYELALFSPPGLDGYVYYQVTRLNTGDVASGTLGPSNGTNLPSTASLMTYMWAYRTNNLTGAAVGLDIMGDYIETDY